jgi:hypothetical protein
LYSRRTGEAKFASPKFEQIIQNILEKTVNTSKHSKSKENYKTKTYFGCNYPYVALNKYGDWVSGICMVLSDKT